MNNRLCYNCMKPGHISKYCPERYPRTGNTLRENIPAQRTSPPVAEQPKIKKEVNLAEAQAGPPIRTYQDRQQLLDNLEAQSRRDREDKEASVEHRADFITWGEESWDGETDANGSVVETPVDAEEENMNDVDENVESAISESDEEDSDEEKTIENTRETLITVDWDDSKETLDLNRKSITREDVKELKIDDEAEITECSTY